MLRSKKKIRKNNKHIYMITTYLEKSTKNTYVLLFRRKKKLMKNDIFVIIIQTIVLPMI